MNTCIHISDTRLRLFVASESVRMAMRSAIVEEPLASVVFTALEASPGVMWPRKFVAHSKVIHVVLLLPLCALLEHVIQRSDGVLLAFLGVRCVLMKWFVGILDQSATLGLCACAIFLGRVKSSKSFFDLLLCLIHHFLTACNDVVVVVLLPVVVTDFPIFQSLVPVIAFIRVGSAPLGSAVTVTTRLHESDARSRSLVDVLAVVVIPCDVTLVMMQQMLPRFQHLLPCRQRIFSSVDSKLPLLSGDVTLLGCPCRGKTELCLSSLMIFAVFFKLLLQAVPAIASPFVFRRRDSGSLAVVVRLGSLCRSSRALDPQL